MDLVDGEAAAAGLHHAAEHGEDGQDIAAEFAITVGGTSKVVDRLEAAGHCRRRANPDDRRSSLIELTRQGRALLDQAMPVFDEELHHRIGNVLPEPQLTQFAATLARLLADTPRSPDSNRRQINEPAADLR